MSQECECHHCPFRFKTNPEGADFDDAFTQQDVADWINLKPFWPCHKDGSAQTPCSGQKLFQAGKAGVTEDEMVRFWVELEPYETC